MHNQCPAGAQALPKKTLQIPFCSTSSCFVACGAPLELYYIHVCTGLLSTRTSHLQTQSVFGSPWSGRLGQQPFRSTTSQRPPYHLTEASGPCTTFLHTSRWVTLELCTHLKVQPVLMQAIRTCRKELKETYCVPMQRKTKINWLVLTLPVGEFKTLWNTSIPLGPSR